MFDVQSRRLGDSLVLDLSGDLGREGGEMVLGAVEGLPALPDRLVLNFHGVGSMNTAGIGGVLWAVRKMNKAERQVFAFGLNDHFRKVFHVMGLTYYIAVVEDEAAALR
ncbi:MAG: STAS domain-containing protein [Bacillota bacterium]